MRERPRTWQQAERRALVADLVRTQRTLQARSEQLQAIFESRWYRLARLFWRLRQGSIFRKAAPPKMAGEDSFARALNGATLAAEEPEVRLVPSPNRNGVAVDLERQRWLAGAAIPGLEELRVAAILDRASEACLAPECELDTAFGAMDWRERLEASPPHMLLVESAFAGNGGGWTGGLAPHPGSPQAGLPALRELIAWCRERGIPSAFWATRDPIGFDRFAEAAALFDHVFTVDADRIGAYRALPDNVAQSVAALPFAAQPRLHNPVTGEGRRHRQPAFVGAFDRTWPHRCREELEELLEAGQHFGLAIYERDSDAIDAEQGFPPRFLRNLQGRISYAETVAVYKRHRVFLTAAGPTASSSSALPRQVLESLACGTPVLSTPSAGIAEILGTLVPVADNREEAIKRLERLIGDDKYRDSLAARGQRHVLAAHTYRDRLAEVVAAVGFDVAAGAGEETAVLLAAAEREELGEIVDALIDQSLAPNEVLLGLPDGTDAERDLDRLAKRFPGARIRTISQQGTTSRSERLRELARLAAAPWVAPMAPTLRYGPHHLRDLVACTRFADAEAIGFAATAGDGPHRYAEAVPPHAALAKRELVAARGWPRDETAMRRWFMQGVRIYAGEASGE
jgi:Glycosyl transferases group 1